MKQLRDLLFGAVLGIGAFVSIAASQPDPVPTDYRIVHDSSANTLSTKVKLEMTKGWVPHGGTATYREGSVMQALVRY